MAKKYVAMIMDRIYSKDGNFIYMANHPEIGFIDEDTEIFTDRNGNEYLSLTEESLLMSEVSDAYYGQRELSKLAEEFGVNSTKEAISLYFNSAMANIYYVTMLFNNKAVVVGIPMEQLKNNTAQVLLAMDDIKTSDSYSHDSSLFDDISDEKDEYREELGKQIKDDVEMIMTEMILGNYSMEEMKKILSYYKERQDDIDSLIESIEINIEAKEGSDLIDKREKEESLVKKKKKYIDLKDLYENVTKTLIAQDEPTKRVIVEIARKEQSPESNNRGLLITGATGVGKTKMMKLIAKYLDRPFYKVDATQLTVPGYVGKDIEEFLWDLYVSCGRDRKKAERAIIFFDEIDKKGSGKKDDVSGRGVLNTLLPFIEGATYDATENVKKQTDTIKIDTTNMIVIMGGAFTDVYKNLKNDQEIGFNRNVLENKNTRSATVEDFVTKAKMPDEFMGRVSIIKLNDLDVDSIKRILLESDESAIKVQQRLFRELGVKLTVGDDFIDAIARNADKRKTGARGLNTVVDESTWMAYGDAYSHIGDIDEIILSEETVNNPKQYRKIYKQVKKAE